MKSNKKYLQEWRQFVEKLLYHEFSNYVVVVDELSENTLSLKIKIKNPINVVDTALINRVIRFMKEKRAFKNVIFNIAAVNNVLYLRFFAIKK